VILVLVSSFSCSAVVLASGLGPIFPMIVRDYPGQTIRANDLQTYPTLFMGIGNLIAMPMTSVIGRRPVFLLSLVLLIVGGIWCAYSQSLGSHIAGRDIMSLAAGQSEALSPLMVQEIHFLHQRGRKLGWFIFIQNFFVGIFFFSETYMVSSWGWRWWYGFFTIFNAVILILSVFLVTETSFNRPDSAVIPQLRGGEIKIEEHHSHIEGSRVYSDDGVELRPDIYGPRTWRGDFKLWSKMASWKIVPPMWLDFVKGFCHPLLLWLLLLNGAYLGLYVFQASTFAGILLQPPFLISFNNLGYVQGAQILVCLVFLPVLGYGSDFVIRFFSRRNKGQYKPEYRLILLVLPATATVICAMIYGQAAQHTSKWNWAAIAVPYNVIFFGFLGANIIGITYAIDSFPTKAPAVLVVLCAGRGLISFGLAYAVLPAIKAKGYDGAMEIMGGIAGGLALLGIPMYFTGPALRRLGQRYYGFGESKKHVDGEDQY
jgi:hypothetical protein